VLFVWIGLAAVLAVIVAVLAFYAAVALCVDPKKTYRADSRFYRSLLVGTTAFALRLLRVRVNLHGGERVPKNVPCLFVCNHRSNFDPLITWCAFREKPMAFIAKPSLFRIPVFGRIIHRCLFMPIDRQSARKAIATFERASELLKMGLSVGVYPEGTRCKTGDMLPFHNGVFRIAQKAQAPIVVLALHDTRTIAAHVPFRASSIDLDVVDVIEPHEWEGVRCQVVGDRARRAIERSLQEKER